MLEMCAEHYFEGIATGNEFWFQYSSYSDSMFADSRESVVPRIQQDISGEKTMVVIFVTSRATSDVGGLPKRLKVQSGVVHSRDISRIVQ
jgi:hypothetical protein